MHSIAHSFARYLPPRVVTNNDLSKLMDTNDEWIQQRSGIKERRFVDEPTTTSDLGTDAAKLSLENAGINSVDCIIAATLSPDYDFPGIGVLIQNKLGLTNIPAFDIRNQCSGFLYGIELADSLIKTGKYEHILVIGAEVHSTGLDFSDRGRDIAVLFGDGAGSCIVSKKSAPTNTSKIQFEIIDTLLGSDGSNAKELWCEHIGSANFPTRITAEMVSEGLIYPKMNGRLVFEHAVKTMTQVSLEVLKRNEIHPDNIKLLIPHQANLRINQAVAKHIGLKPEQAFSTIENYGNTTAATIPIGFSHAIEETSIKSGDYILSAAFGSGFTWGSALFRCL